MQAQTYRLNGKAHLRYSRYDATAPAHALQITPRLLDRLYAFFVHGYLSTEMVHRLIQPGTLQENTTCALKLMKRQPNGFIETPEGQRHTDCAKSNRLVYAISERGVDILVNANRITTDQAILWKKLRQNRAEFFHDFGVSYTTFSIHLGAIEKGLRFIPWHEILSHPKCPAATRSADNPYMIRCMIDGAERYLITDGLCGIADQSPPPIFYAIEMDTGTESQSVISTKGKAYHQLLAHKLHTRHFGFTEIEVLFVTLGELRLRNLARTIHRVAQKSKTTAQFKFKAVPQLRRTEKPPITGQMLTSPWSAIDETKTSSPFESVPLFDRHRGVEG